MVRTLPLPPESEDQPSPSERPGRHLPYRPRPATSPYPPTRAAPSLPAQAGHIALPADPAGHIALPAQADGISCFC